MNTQRLAILLDKYVTETISEPENVELFELMKQPESREYIEERMLLEISEGQYDRVVDDNVKTRIQLKLNNSLAELVKDQAPIYTIRNKKVWAWAAAILILVTASVLYFMLQPRSSTIKTPSVEVKNDIQPGKSGAILKLADGTDVLLDEKNDGLIADQKGAVITLKAGSLVYDKSKNKEKDAVNSYNTISTPRGRQFRLLLPDGSNVWLNAESSITFPVVFAANERKVTIKGELYFEVAHQELLSGKRMPFIVTTEKGIAINVLGTHFNVKAYDDDAVVRTTLLEGKVELVSGDKQQAILVPGEEADAYKNGAIQKIDHPDLEDAMAWKDGFFFFGKKDIASIMKELSRWYDVDIKYTNGITSELFNGKITRNVPVSKVLELLGLTEQVHFKIEGKTITVLP